MRLSPAWLSDSELQNLIVVLEGCARFVGGCVRDAFLGISARDIDLATVFPPQEIIRLLKNSGITALETGVLHGTVTALLPNRSVEITTLRRDVSCDGRHAKVEFSDSWEEDAERRDFTCNALSMNAGGEVFDYFDGIADLEKKIVRFVGDPALRVREDYLRVLRYFRFLARFSGPIDSASMQACAQAVAGIDQLSGERIYKEMRALLQEKHASRSLALVQDYKIILPFLPQFSAQELRALKRLENLADCIPEAADHQLRAAVLLVFSAGEQQEFFCKRLRYPLAEAKILQQLIPAFALDLHDFRTWRIFAVDNGLRLAVLAALGVLTLAENFSAEKSIQQITEMHAWKIPEFPLKGRDLLGLGLKPSPEIGAMLVRARKHWVDSDFTFTGKQLLEKLGADSGK
jgi:poly(A) polymerase